MTFVRREYPPEIIDLVVSSYAAGMTVAEIRALLPSGYKAQTLVERFVPERRKAVSREQRGSANPHWKGERAGYSALHLRVVEARGAPTACERCDKNDPAARYEWANQTGDYADVDDYERLCVSCHRRQDAARRKAAGALTTPPHLREGVRANA